MTMLRRIRRITAVPVFADEEKTRVARLLHHIVIAVGIGALLSIVNAFTTPSPTNRPLFPFIIVVASAVCFIALYRWPRPACLLFTSGLWLLTTVSVATSAGVRADSFGVYVLAIILAAILLDESYAIGFTVLTIVVGLALLYAERAGLLFTAPFPPSTPEGTLTIQITVLLGTATLLFMTARGIRRTFRQLQQTDEQLAERNQELERQIAERQHVEAERNQIDGILRTNEAKYRQLFENTGLSTVIYEPAGTIVLINQRFAHIFGGQPSEFVGRSLFAVLRPELVEFHRQQTQRVIETGKGDIGELEVRSEKQWFLLNTQPLFDGQGKLYALQLVAQEITARKQLEKQEHELAIALEKASFLSEFLGTISHDIKTPLTMINTSLYLLEKNQDPIQQRDRIQQIKAQTLLVEKFIQDILTVSRLDFLPGLSYQPVDVNRLLAEVVAQLSAKADQKQITLRLDPTPDNPAVAADVDELQRAFTNLIDNALNYTPAAGSVTVRTLRQPDWIVIEVADTGIGINADDVPHIFDRFYRSSEARSLVKSGTGLGLAIVKKIFDMHHGRIEVSSAPGQGTTFRLLMPVDRLHQAA